MLQKRNIFLLLIVFSYNSLLLSGQEGFKGLEKELQAKMTELVQQHDLPGMTLAIVLDDENPIKLAAGLADKDKQQPMQPESRMLAGSVGKMFVSAIALRLVTDGEISLSAHLKDYLGDKPWYAALPNGADIRIRDLMQHTSGIPRYILQAEFLESIREEPLAERSPEECIAYVLNKTPLHPSGKGWGYSDTNYLLLGLVIEQVSGRAYNDLLREWLLDPLKLDFTTPSTQREFPGLTQGYIGSQNFFNLPKEMLQDGKLAVNPAFEWTGGGVVTNTTDLARWAKTLHEGGILEAEIYQQMIQPVSMQTGQTDVSGYGLGTFVWNIEDEIRYGHAGFFPGYVTRVEYAPKARYAMAIQINTDDGYSLLNPFLRAFDELVASYLD